MFPSALIGLLHAHFHPIGGGGKCTQNLSKSTKMTGASFLSQHST
jgi:hypothetical protein